MFLRTSTGNLTGIKEIKKNLYNIFQHFKERNKLNEHLLVELFSSSSIFIHIRKNPKATARGVRYFL